MIKFDRTPHDICEISSPFGPRNLSFSPYHYGVDIRPKKPGHDGDILYSVAPGIVRVAKINGGGIKVGYGYYIVIEHEGFSTLYGHLKGLDVKVGQTVKSGTVVGHMGNTGQSTGTHLHFSLIPGPYSLTKNKSHYIDPLPYLKGAKLMTEEQAKQIIKERAGLSDKTIEYLSAYPYAKELLIKLATPMR